MEGKKKKKKGIRKWKTTHRAESRSQKILITGHSVIHGELLDLFNSFIRYF